MKNKIKKPVFKCKNIVLFTIIVKIYYNKYNLIITHCGDSFNYKKEEKATKKAKKPSARHLVIVESPAKAKTIEKFLGRSYVVRASYGHVRDLPKTRLGIDIEDNFVPKYIELKDKKTILKELKTLAKAAPQFTLPQTRIVKAKPSLGMSRNPSIALMPINSNALSFLKLLKHPYSAPLNMLEILTVLW
jgi:hypothetical protein